MPKPRRIQIDDALLRRFAEGRLDPEAEMKVAVAIEKSPELQARMAAVSNDGFLDRVKEIVAERRMLNSVAPEQQKATTSIESSSPTFIDGVPQELVESPDYQVLKELGRGGMGVVYAAKYLPMDRMEVLKVLNDRMVQKEAAKQRFISEMKAIGKLNHPFIATAYQRVVLPTQLVFSMEYVPGTDLHKFVQKYHPLPIPVACTLASQIATALQHAHSRKMVHRDIKPSNVMVFKEDGKLQIKILDFGLAKATSEQQAEGLTANGTMLGTPEYMAPEQALDAASADIRADIYSLGCTLYHLLMGRPPFTGTYQSVLMAHAQKEADYISFERLDVPVELSEVVAKMMAKEPAKRFQTPKAVSEALKPFIGSEKLNRAPATQPAAKIDTKLHLASPSRDTSVEMPAIPVVPTPPVKAEPDLATSLANLKVDDRNVRKQTKAGTIRKSSRRKRPPYFSIIAGAFFAAIIYWAIVISIQTPTGTLVFENLPDDAEVFVDGDKVTVTWDENNEQATVAVMPGSRNVQVRHRGIKAEGAMVTIASNEDSVIVVRSGSIVKSTPDDLTQQPPAEELVERKFALEFDGNGDYVRLANLRYRGDHPITMEAWVQLSVTAEGNIISDIEQAGVCMGTFGMSAWSNGYKRALATNIPRNRLVHLAGVFVPGDAVRFYVEGKLQTTSEKTHSFKPSPFSFLLGGNPNPQRTVGNCLTGQIESVRVSKIARYSQSFIPEKQLSSDTDTLALYLINEGHGTEIRDSSGHGHHGTITGAKWVEIQEPESAPNTKYSSVWLHDRGFFEEISPKTWHEFSPNGGNYLFKEVARNDDFIELIALNGDTSTRFRLFNEHAEFANSKRPKFFHLFDGWWHKTGDETGTDARDDAQHAPPWITSGTRLRGKKTWTTLSGGMRRGTVQAWEMRIDRTEGSKFWAEVQIDEGEDVRFVEGSTQGEHIQWASPDFPGHMFRGKMDGTNLRAVSINGTITASRVAGTGLSTEAMDANSDTIDTTRLNQLIQPGSVWRSSDSVQELLILDRSADQFRGRLKAGPRIVREVRGTILGDRISWLAKDVNGLGGSKQGGDNSGVIRTDSTGIVIDFTWQDSTASGTFVLHAAETLEAPDDALQLGDRHFKIFNQKLNWHEARDECTRLGGTLAKVDTEEIHSQILQQAQTQGVAEVWLGATDEATEGSWQWLDGSEMTFARWEPSQPNNKQGSEHYAVLIASSKTPELVGTWCDQPLSSTQHQPGFVCEWRIAHEEPGND